MKNTRLYLGSLITIFSLFLSPPAHAQFCGSFFGKAATPRVDYSRFERPGRPAIDPQNPDLLLWLATGNPFARALYLSSEAQIAEVPPNWDKIDDKLLTSQNSNDLKRFLDHPIWAAMRQNYNPPGNDVLNKITNLIKNQNGTEGLNYAGAILLRLTENPVWLHAIGADLAKNVLSQKKWVNRQESTVVIEYLLALPEYYQWRGYNIPQIDAALWENVILNPMWTTNPRYLSWAKSFLERHQQSEIYKIQDLLAVQGVEALPRKKVNDVLTVYYGIKR